MKNWSTYQEAVFADVASGDGHTVVRARAGSGKTTTIVESFKHVPAGLSVLMVAFNKSIAAELQTRAPAGVTVNTLHSFGFAAIRQACGKVSLDNRKVDRLIVDMLGNADESKAYRKALAKAVSLAKGILAETPEEIDDLIDTFELEVRESARPTFCQDALDIMADCRRDTRSIDFDDMIWLPVVLKMRVKQFDRVFVDETQDLNKCQIELALSACKKNGRICAVGDDRQAIYGFRGADSQAMPNVIGALRAKVLPLSVTYRCAKLIVDEAKTIVSDYEAGPGSEDGEVAMANRETLERDAKAGDFILSRANAPLIGLCLSFLKRGVAASVAGRDVGAGLIALIEKSRAASVPELAEWIDVWQEAEITRITRRKIDADTSSVEDRAACIQALCEGARSVQEIKDKIDGLFSDTDAANRIMLSTTHKAKGLERDRVWILMDTYRPKKSTEEANLYYVAVTRARKSLFKVYP